MVSTRGIKYAFSEGEKVLCYEPDPTKAKVLYDSKVLEIFDTRDRRGRRIVEYLIHFQGWNSSWDRRVSETFVLKDNVVNRQLQKDLAEKSQLCLGAYLYRKDRKKSKSSGSAEVAETTTPVTFPTPAKEEHELQMQDNDAESYSSSTESGSGPIEDEKVIIQVSKKLREFMEFDNRMVTKEYRLAVLPAQIPIVTILEKFVKQCSVKLICNYIRQDHRKRRNSTTRSDKEPLDTEKLTNKLNLYKEVADGLRIYFDFTLKDHLLYSQEQQQAEMVLDEEYLKTFTYIPSEKSFTDLIFPSTSEKSTPTSATEVTDDTARRRLRSYKLEADYVGTDGAMPFAAKITEILRSVQPLNSSVPLRMKMLLQNTLAWHLLPSNAPAEPSMIYGAPHLARLLIKLPEFLTHSIGTMSEEKMKHLLDYLGELLEFLEDHTNWFGEEHYHTSLIKMEMED